MTVYKVQGITLDKAVVDITARKFTSGLRYVAVLRVKTVKTLMFKKLFDFSLFTTSLRSIGIVRKADIDRRALERLMPKNGSDKDIQDTYIRSRQTIRDSQYRSINKIMNQYLDEDYAAGLGVGDSLGFNKDDFIRLGRRARHTARNDEDELIIAGGLGAETQQE